MTSVDVSDRMLDQLRSKLESTSFASLVDVRHGELTRLAPDLPGSLDGVISSFAALNTVDLMTFGKTAASLLRPGGRLVCHMLSPGYLTGGIRGVLARRGESPVPEGGGANINVGGQALTHLLLAPGETYSRFFSADFVLRRSYALGFLVPRKIERHLPDQALSAAAFSRVHRGEVPAPVRSGRFFVLISRGEGSSGA